MVFVWKVLHFFEKSSPNRSRKPPGTSRSSSFWGSWGSPGALLPGRSREPLGSLWGASWEPLGSLLGPPKTFQNRSRRLSRRPPAPELDFRSILGVMLAQFWDPPDLKNKVFVWNGCAFLKKSSRNGKRVRSESRKHRKRRKTRGKKHQQRREEPEQSTRRHSQANVSRATRASRLRVWWVACSRGKFPKKKREIQRNWCRVAPPPRNHSMFRRNPQILFFEGGEAKNRCQKPPWSRPGGV